MTIRLKQSTTSQEVPLGYFVDSTDGNTEETALTINNTDIKLWKAGATTLANKNSGGATHISNGIYYCTLDDTDTNTLGPLVIFVHVSGALAVRVECEVLAANVYDSLIGATDKLDVNVEEWNATAVPAEHTAGYPIVTVKDGTGTGEIDTTAGAVPVSGTVTVGTNNDKTGYALSAASIQAIWDALTSALTTVGSIGKLLVDNINATISSRASQTSLDTVAGYVDTEVAAIKAKTDNLPADPASASTVASSFTTVNTKLDTIDDYVDTEIAAIKAVTDLLTTAQAEPSAAPAANETPLNKLAFIFAALRNKLTVTSSAKTFYKDDGTTLWSKSLADDGTTYTENEGA